MTKSNVQPGESGSSTPGEVEFLLALIDFLRGEPSPRELVEWLATMDDLEAKLGRALALTNGHIWQILRDEWSRIRSTLGTTLRDEWRRACWLLRHP